MGWLRPEPTLIQAPAWDEHGGAYHASPDQGRADHEVPARGQTVRCTRVVGSSATAVEVQLDDGFTFCPLLADCGYPLMLKREPQTDGAALSHDLDALATKMHALKLMTSHISGLDPLWQVGGEEALPPILAARADGVPFLPNEWKRMRQFFDDVYPVPDVMLEAGTVPHPDACRDMEAFEKALRRWCEPVARRRAAKQPKPTTLAERYPVGSRVEAQDLKKVELNSLVGVVRQYDESKGRVGVEFPPPHGLLSLRTKNLIPLATPAEESAPAAEESVGPAAAPSASAPAP